MVILTKKRKIAQMARSLRLFCSGNLFPFNHIIDNDEFKFALCYFNNSVEYNKLLNLKFNPYLYECTAQDNIGQINLDNYNTCNSCNYVFNLSLDSKCSF